MSGIDELIERLCPDGVQYRVLGEIAKYSKDRIPASKVADGCYVGVNELLLEYRGRSYEIHYPAEERCIAFHPGDVLLGNIRPYLRKMWLADCEGGTNGDVLVIRVNDATEVVPEFLWQVLAGGSLTEYNIQHSKGAKMPRGDKKAILNARIPVPPMEVQQEIVRVLDSFAELEARQRQYAHYRKEILNCEDLTGIRYLRLGDIARVGSSKRVFTKEFTNDGVPFYRGTEIGMLAERKPISPELFISPEHYASLVEQTGKPEIGDLLFPSICPDGRIWLVNDDSPFYIKDGRVLWIHPTDQDVDNAYLCHAFSNYLQCNYEKVASGTSFAELKIFTVKNCALPFPSIEEQRRIASILDTYETLVNDFEQGIPAEIEARRKQYAYYRDKLLAFKEKVA